MLNHMKLSAMLRYMQDAANLQMEVLGFPHEKMLENQQVFLLSKVELEVLSPPLAQQNITVRTRPHPPKGVYFLRESRIDADKKPLVLAKSAWILVHPGTHQVLRPSALDWNPDFGEDEFDASLVRQKIKEPENLVCLGERKIRFSDLDANRHVNNAVYGDILFDFLPEDLVLQNAFQKMRLHYEHEAVLGDTLQIFGCDCGNGMWYLTGKTGEKSCFRSEVFFFGA